MPLSTDPTTAAISRYSDDFNGQFLAEHGVTSPLGLWLLLALLAPVAHGADRDHLEQVLGASATDAFAKATALLSTAHPAVKSALAAWANETFVDGAAFGRWTATLPNRVESGPVPSQEQADAWAKRSTLDLIGSFPLPLSRDTALVLASALAAKVTWRMPFEDATPQDLGGEFAPQVEASLRAPDGHQRALWRTQAAGVVGAHVASSDDGLLVVSVIADPDVAPRAVHRAASEVAAGLRVRSADPVPGAALRLSLFDVPLGPGHAWDVTEEVVERAGHAETAERVDAILPAWAASSKHDLGHAPGAAAASRTLASFMRSKDVPVSTEVTQSARAAFSKEGFEAAAVTAMAVRATGLPVLRMVRQRSATIRFNRPYAVVAVATDQDAKAPWRRDPLLAAWDQVPVFSAWVGQPRD